MTTTSPDELSPREVDETIKGIALRENGLRNLERQFHPGYDPPNAYLMSGRIENVAWHHGYRVACADILGWLGGIRSEDFYAIAKMRCPKCDVHDYIKNDGRTGREAHYCGTTLELVQVGDPGS